MPAPAAAMIEIMEPRTLLSAAVTPVSGGWLVTDTGSVADSLTVTFDTAASQFTVSGVAGTFTDASSNITIALNNTAGTTLTLANSAGSGAINNFGGSLQINNLNGSSPVAGNDTVNLNTGITFAPDANLGVNLAFVAASDTDAIRVGPNAALVLSGSGTATLTSDASIALASGASLVTQDGNITVSANQQATSTMTSSVGVAVTGATISSTGAGQVSVEGTAGMPDAFGYQYGVQVSNGGTISGGTLGTLTVQGASTGSTATSPQQTNYGVFITGGSINADDTISTTAVVSNVTSSGANVSVNGTAVGNAASSTNIGVILQYDATLTAGSSGTVNVTGSGTDKTSFTTSNFGIVVEDTVTTPGSSITASIASSGGAVTVNGTADGEGFSASNLGVQVQGGGQITAGASGAVTVTGNGTDPVVASFYFPSYGVSVTGSGLRITSGGGLVQVIGTGAQAGVGVNYGVGVTNGAQIAAGGSGATQVTGTGSYSGGDSVSTGVFVSDPGSAISSNSGNVSVIGTGDASVAALSGQLRTVGVDLENGAQITAGANGTVTITGTGANSSGRFSFNTGVSVSGSTITSSGGNVSVTGNGGITYNESIEFGVYLQPSGQITAGGTGTVTVNGTGGNYLRENMNVVYGVLVKGTGAVITSGGGAVSITGAGGGDGPGLGLNPTTGVQARVIGVGVIAGGEISAGGSASVTVSGTAGHAQFSRDINNGVFVGDSDPGFGVSMITSGGGDVTVIGNEGGGNAGTAVVVADIGEIITSTTGNVALIGDTMSIDSTGVIGASSSNTVTLEQFTNGVSIDLGSVDNNFLGFGTILRLNTAELDEVVAGTIVIGNAQSGTVNVSQETDINNAGGHVKIVSGSDVAITGGQINTNTGAPGATASALELDPGSAGAVKPTLSNTDVTTTTLTINGSLAIAMDGTTPDTQFTQLDVAGSVDLAGASLALSGSYTPTAADSFVIVQSTGAVNHALTGLPAGTVVTANGVQKQLEYNASDVALEPLGAPPVNLAAPDVVYSGAQYAGATADLGGTTSTGYVIAGQPASLEGVGIVYTYYAGPTATGTPISPPTDVGTYTVVASFAGSASYLSNSATATFHITRATATVVMTPYTVTYDGMSHAATVASITGVNGETGATVGTADVSNTAHTNAGTYSADTWSFAGSPNYNDIGPTTIADVIDKADATVNVPPTINSGTPPATATVGTLYTYTLSATGTPPSTLSASGLPADGWLTFDPSTGVLSGTPGAADASTTSTITLTAANGFSPNATRTFSLLVDQPPAFNSANHTTIPVQLAGSFIVTATGYPAPTVTESNTDLLPAGVTFDSQTGILGGTPAAGTIGTYLFHFTASNGVSPNATETFTLKVTPQFPFAGEYAVSTGSGTPTLATIAPAGAQYVLIGSTVAVASVATQTQLQIGATTANYGNSQITFGSSGPFATQTWTKLDLPANYTTARGAATQVNTNGNSITFVNENGTPSAAAWLNPTQLTAFGLTVTVGSGKLTFSNGTVWYENVSLPGTLDGKGSTNISARPNQFTVLDFTNPLGKSVHIIETGTTQVVFVDGPGRMSLGSFTNAASTQATADLYPGDPATFAGGDVFWQDGSVWVPAANPSPQITVTDFTNQNGVATHVIRNGTANVVFADGFGQLSLGKFSDATHANSNAYPGDVATFATNSVSWQDGSTWTMTGALTGAGITNTAPFTVVDYTNPAGTPVQLVRTGTAELVFIDGLGRISLGSFINATQANANLYPGDIATFNGNAISWQDGSHWLPAATPSPQVTVTDFINQNGLATHIIRNGTTNLAFVDGLGQFSLGSFINATQATCNTYPGDIATFAGTTVTWQDGAVWTRNGSPPITITATDANNHVSHLRLSSSTMLIGVDGIMQGVVGTRLNGKIFWMNGQIWDNLNASALNAFFEMGTGYA